MPLHQGCALSNESIPSKGMPNGTLLELFLVAKKYSMTPAFCPRKKPTQSNATLIRGAPPGTTASISEADRVVSTCWTPPMPWVSFDEQVHPLIFSPEKCPGMPLYPTKNKPAPDPAIPFLRPDTTGQLNAERAHTPFLPPGVLNVPPRSGPF